LSVQILKIAVILLSQQIKLFLLLE